MNTADLIFYFFSIHFGVSKVSKDASEILTVYVSCVSWIIESKGIFDFILLYS